MLYGSAVFGNRETENEEMFSEGELEKLDSDLL